MRLMWFYSVNTFSIFRWLKYTQRAFALSACWKQKPLQTLFSNALRCPPNGASTLDWTLQGLCWLMSKIFILMLCCDLSHHSPTSTWLTVWFLSVLSYLWETLHLSTKVDARRGLRSASMSTRIVPSTGRSTLGDRAFPLAAARAWNSLPPSVRSTSSLASFCLHLTTHLFAVSFPRWHSMPS